MDAATKARLKKLTTSIVVGVSKGVEEGIVTVDQLEAAFKNGAKDIFREAIAGAIGEGPRLRPLPTPTPEAIASARAWEKRRAAYGEQMREAQLAENIFSRIVLSERLWHENAGPRLAPMAQGALRCARALIQQCPTPESMDLCSPLYPPAAPVAADALTEKSAT